MNKALIIIDMWDQYIPGNKRFDGLLEQLGLKLQGFMQQSDMPVVVSSYPNINHDFNDTSNLKGTSNMIQHGLFCHAGDSIVSWDKEEVLTFLKLHNVTDLYFAGVSFPGCVQGRQLGIDAMKDDFNCFIVADFVLDLLSLNYTEYDIINSTYTAILQSDYQYTCSKQIEKVREKGRVR